MARGLLGAFSHAGQVEEGASKPTLSLVGESLLPFWAHGLWMGGVVPGPGAG